MDSINCKTFNKQSNHENSSIENNSLMNKSKDVRESKACADSRLHQNGSTNVIKSSIEKKDINIVLVVDLNRQTSTLSHRKAIVDCVKNVCDEMGANFKLINCNELEHLNPQAKDSLYDADAAVIDISLENQGNMLYHNLGVRESFSMKQNLLLVADTKDIEIGKFLNNDERQTTSSLSYEAAAQIKSRLPNYSLFVYSIIKDEVSGKNECFLNQKFVDLTSSPGSDEQIDPTTIDFDVNITDDEQQNSSEKENKNSTIEIVNSSPTTNTDGNLTMSESLLCLKALLKNALKNVKWQAKVHMKEKFLADLKKVRESLQGQELIDQLAKFRQKLSNSNMLSIEVVHQLLISYRELQDYNEMVELVDELCKNPNFSKITNSPQILYHHAFALNRRHNYGDSKRALELIQNALKDKEHQTPDSICLCGRIFKDRFIESHYEDKESLNNAIHWYREGFKIQPNEYAAINLATLLYIKGKDFNTSNELKHIGLLLNNLIGRKGPVHKLENYWDVATYFEFCVLSSQHANALEAAECMFILKPQKWHLKSTIGNIKLIYTFNTPKQQLQQQQQQQQSSNDSYYHSQQRLEIVQTAEEQIVDFWMDFFIDSVLDSCDYQIRFAVVVYEGQVNMPTYITMNLEEEEKSLTISQMCLKHLQNSNECRKPHTWHINASDIRFTSLHKKDERCLFLYVNTDDFQIFFPSEALRARFNFLVQSITGSDRELDLSANLKSDRVVNYEFELDSRSNARIILGRGSRGVVYAAQDTDTQTQIAIKEVPVKNINQVQPLHEEIRLHSLLRHRNIVQYLGSKDEGKYFRIIMERVPGGSLSQLLQNKWGPLKENVIAYYSKQILDGLNYLHRQKIVHRDIKGDNVLVNTYNGTVKISDFGTCKRLAAINPNTETFAGTIPFMAPEVLDGGQRGYGMQADVWSFGCTLVEMATGKPPFIEIESGAQVMFRIGYYKEHPEIPSHLSEKCSNFVLRCFDPNPENRATCKELLQDEFLKGSRAALVNSSSTPQTATCYTPASPQSADYSSTSSKANENSRKNEDSEYNNKTSIEKQTSTSIDDDDADDNENDNKHNNVDDNSINNNNDNATIDNVNDNNNENDNKLNDVCKQNGALNIDKTSTGATNSFCLEPNNSNQQSTLKFQSISQYSTTQQSKSTLVDTKTKTYSSTITNCNNIINEQKKHDANKLTRATHNKFGLNVAKLDRLKLIQLNEDLAQENRDLLSQLYQTQSEMQLVLKMQLSDKIHQLNSVKSSTRNN